VNILAVAHLTADTDLLADEAVNTFAFKSNLEVDPETDLFDLAQYVEGFWNVFGPDYATVDRLSGYMSVSRSRSPDRCLIELFDVTDHLDGSPHGGPVLERNWTLGNAGGGSPFPEEVAICLTIRGGGWATQPIEVADGADPDAAPDRPRQRHSGRLYLGPWQNTVQTTVDDRARPSADIHNAILDAAQQLALNVSTLDNDWRWCVWSRKNAAMYTIEDLQVDNAFDTMRSRGVSPTFRRTRPSPVYP